MDLSPIPYTGAELIAAERERQIHDKGYAPESDDQQTDGSLLIAGLLIGLDVAGHEMANVDPPDRDGPWPDQLLLKVRAKYAGDDVRRLEIAGAMIAAEIDRLVRRRGP